MAPEEHHESDVLQVDKIGWLAKVSAERQNM
jgi:hypothetical protein